MLTLPLKRKISEISQDAPPVAYGGLGTKGQRRLRWRIKAGKKNRAARDQSGVTDLLHGFKKLRLE